MQKGLVVSWRLPACSAPHGRVALPPSTTCSRCSYCNQQLTPRIEKPTENKGKQNNTEKRENKKVH